MPGGVVPTDPDRLLVHLFDAVKQAERQRSWDAVRLALADAERTVEKTRLSLVDTDPPPQ
jgi:hypothetical protein